jgi:hypothetical protein
MKVDERPGSVSPSAVVESLRSSRNFGADPALVMLGFHCLSILWIAWDPYWLRRARSRGRAKVKGRDVWIVSVMPGRVLRTSDEVTVHLCLSSKSDLPDFASDKSLTDGSSVTCWP